MQKWRTELWNELKYSCIMAFNLRSGSCVVVSAYVICQSINFFPPHVIQTARGVGGHHYYRWLSLTNYFSMFPLERNQHYNCILWNSVANDLLPKMFRDMFPVMLSMRRGCCGLVAIHYLTHWGRDKMAAISQTTFSNAFSWMKMYEFRLKIHWSLFLKVQLTISQHWFR